MCFVPSLAEGVDVLRFFHVCVRLGAQFRNVEGVRRSVRKQRASLDGAAPEFQRESVGAACHIWFRNFENAARRGLDFSAGGSVVLARRCTSNPPP